MSSVSVSRRGLGFGRDASSSGAGLAFGLGFWRGSTAGTSATAAGSSAGGLGSRGSRGSRGGRAGCSGRLASVEPGRISVRRREGLSWNSLNARASAPRGSRIIARIMSSRSLSLRPSAIASSSASSITRCAWEESSPGAATGPEGRRRFFPVASKVRNASGVRPAARIASTPGPVADSSQARKRCSVPTKSASSDAATVAASARSCSGMVTGIR